MSKRIFNLALLVMALLSSVAASADDFTVGDLKYTVLDGTQNVKVEAASSSISGAVVIPATVTNTATNTTYNVTEVAYKGFHSCQSLTSVVVPNSVTTLGAAAFANSQNLTDVTIGSGVTALTCDGSLEYGGTFEMCNKLERVTFAEGSQLTTIEHWAFHRCYKLKELVFPSTVTHIGHRVFYHCYDLTRIVLPVSAVPTIITTPTISSSNPPYNPFDEFSGSSDFRIEVPAAALPSFLAADIWKDKKYAMQLTGTNVANFALKSVFGTVNQTEIDSHGHLFITYANDQEAYWYLNNTQEQNVSFVLNACSYQDYRSNDLTLTIISLADDGTETVHETQQIHLFNLNNTSGNKLQYKVDLLNVLPVGRYKVKLNAVKDRIEFNELYIGSPDKFYCAEYEVKPFGAGDLTPNKQTPNVKWYFTTPTDIELTANPTDTWSTFANWTDENGNVISSTATSTFNVNGHKKYVANFIVAAQSIPTDNFNSQQAALYTTSDASSTIQWVERSDKNSAQFEYVREGDIATYYVSSTKPALYNMKFKTSNLHDASANYTIEVADKDNNVIFTSSTTTIAKTSGWYGSDMTEQVVPITVPLLPNETYTVNIKFGSTNHSSEEICNYCDVNFELAAVVADRIALDKSAETVKVDATTTLVATATASTSDEVTEGYDGVEWTTSNAAVATVANGVVTAISAGEAVITATGAQVPAAKASCTISVPQPVTSITAPETAEVYTGENITVAATANPTDAAEKNLAWASSNEAVATVDQNGKITGVKAGTATITITATDRNKVTKTIVVTVKQKVTAITLNETTKTINKGETLQLTATCAPADATLKEVTWTSSNEAVAEVSATGLVTAKAGGSATITSTAKDGKGATATCAITVDVPVTSVTLNQTSATVYKTQTVQLTATVNPEDATVKTVSWKSSNTAIATVSETGLVTAVDAGNATITVTSTADATKFATFTLTVQSKSAYGEGENALYFVEAVNDNTQGDNHVAWDNATDKNWVANSIVLTDAESFACPYDVAATTLTYNRTFAVNSWQPLYVPFATTASEWTGAAVAELAGVHMYNDGRKTTVEFVTVEATGTVKANMPYVILPETSGTKTYTFSGKTLKASPAEGENFISCGSPRYTYKFYGNYASMTSTDIENKGEDGFRPYIMGSNNSFINAATGATLSPFRFYIVKKKSENGYWGAPARSAVTDDEILLMVDGNVVSTETTGIFNVIVDGEDGNYYDLQGRRIEVPRNGIFIHNGKKVLVK